MKLLAWYQYMGRASRPHGQSRNILKCPLQHQTSMPKHAKGKSTFLLWGTINTSIISSVLLEIFMLYICVLWKLLKHHGKLGSDRILYRKSYSNSRILYRKSFCMTLLGPGWPESHTVQSSTPSTLDYRLFLLEILWYEAYWLICGPGTTQYSPVLLKVQFFDPEAVRYFPGCCK